MMGGDFGTQVGMIDLIRIIVVAVLVLIAGIGIGVSL